MDRSRVRGSSPCWSQPPSAYSDGCKRGGVMAAPKGFHPGSWLAWASGGGLAAVLTTNPFYLLVACAASWLVYTAHRKPGPQLRSFRIFVTFGLIAMATRTALVLIDPLMHVPITTSSVVLALLEGGRIATLLCIFGTFNSVADPYDILRLSPRRLYEPMLAVGLALSLAPLNDRNGC